MLKRLQPAYAIDLVGPRELLVNGRRLDLENLYRMVNHEPVRGQEIVEHYLDQLFAGDATRSTACRSSSPARGSCRGSSRSRSSVTSPASRWRTCRS